MSMIAAACLVTQGCAFVVPDYRWRAHMGKPAPVEYRAWASYPDVALAGRDTKTCDVTVFALSTAREPVGLIADGRALPPDTSWSLSERVEAGVLRVWTFDFRKPGDGSRLACREVQVACVTENGILSNIRRAPSCEDAVKVKADRVGKPRLAATVNPPITMAQAQTGGAEVTVRFAVEGEPSEAWYCPRVEVRWPDDTVTSRESDCPPWPSEAEDRAWKFTRAFPPGEWTVRGCVSKAGHTLACTDAVVRVVGG